MLEGNRLAARRWGVLLLSGGGDIFIGRRRGEGRRIRWWFSGWF